MGLSGILGVWVVCVALTRLCGCLDFLLRFVGLWDWALGFCGLGFWVLFSGCLISGVVCLFGFVDLLWVLRVSCGLWVFFLCFRGAFGLRLLGLGLVWWVYLLDCDYFLCGSFVTGCGVSLLLCYAVCLVCALMVFYL